MPDKSLSRIWHALKAKGAFLPANLAVAGFLIWLIVPYFQYRSASPVFFGRYSLRFVVFLLVISALISMYGYFAVIGSRRMNVVLLSMVAGIFLLGEAMARLLIKSPTPIHREYAEAKPYVQFANRPHATFAAYQLMYVTPENAPKGEETLNEIGFRGPAPPRPKVNEYRIIVLGGSTVFAGFPLSNSISGQLESRFHQNGNQNVKVYNWGVEAYISGQELSLLAHKVFDYEPDLVIVYDGANDTFFPFLDDPRPDYPFLFMEYESHMRDFKSGISGNLVAVYLRKSKFLTWALSLVPNSRVDPLPRASDIETLRNAAGYPNRAWEKSVVECYVANHRRMCVVTRGENAKLLSVLQPTLAFKQRLTGKQELGWDPSPEFLAYCRNASDQMWRGLSQTSRPSDGCYSLDLRNLFAGTDKEVFVDAFHVTNEGNTRAADRIYDEIKRLGLPPSN